MPLTYREQRSINASAEKVYDIITRFDDYPEWNPWITSAQGETTPGSAVTVTAMMHGTPRVFKHLIIAAERPAHFHWCDVGWFTLFVDGERERRIERIDDNSCRYICELRVRGIGTVFAKLFFGKFMREGLKAEAHALKQYAEHGKPLTMNAQLQFSGQKTDTATEGRITHLLRGIKDKRLDKKWMRVEVMMHPILETPTAVEHTHKIWNADHVPSVKSPEGLPCLPGGTPCPPGSRLIEVSYISQLSGGMGSYHQFDGYFVSLVLAPDLASILDARMEKAY